MDRKKKNNKAGGWGILLVCCFALVSTRVFSAGVEVDGATNTTLETAPNGVPIVNIANPNTRGLSHNSYIRFNVGNPGLILNNADQTVVNTQLGGHILGNSHLTAPARVILNEVTSTNPSILNGYTEVAGQRADIVIANPNGISINGAGFINSSRVTLTTGIPTIDAFGNLGGFDVRGGEISVTGSGLNTQLQDSTSIYTHFLNLNARLHAKDLDIALGKNQIDYPGRKIVSSGKGTVNRVLLDSSALGGMYANKIVMVGTDKGLGMNLPPEVIASSGDIRISNDGRLVLQKVDAGRNIALQSTDDIESSDTIYAAGSIDINTPDELNVRSGMIAANSRLSIDAETLNNEATLLAGLDPDGAMNDSGEAIIKAGDLNNSGEFISTRLLDASASAITNRGLLNASEQLDVNAGSLVNEATLFSGGNTRLHVKDNLHNTVDAAIFSVNDLELAADSDGNKTTQITNELGLIQSLHGDIDIFATRFDNLGAADIQYQMVYYDLGKGREVDRPGDAMSLDLAYSTGYTKHRSKARRRWVNEVLDRLSRQAPLLYQANASAIKNNRSANFLAIESRLIDNSTTTPALLDSGNDLNLHVDSFNNQDAVAAAARDIRFDIASSYLNNATFESESVTDYRYYTRAKHKKNWKSDDKYSSIGRSGYAPVVKARKVTSDTVTQAGRNITGHIDGQVVNSGVLAGKYQPVGGINPSDYDKSAIAIPGNDFGLFVKSTAPDSRYLIETNPRFTNLGIFLSSSYLLDRLDFSSNITLKRLGDAFYESKLIRDSVLALSGRRYLDASIQNDNQQFQYLMDNALAAQRTLELAPGVALNKNQINRLTRDIVWLEEMQVEGQAVLVPKVYLANGPRARVRGGKILAGGDTRLEIARLTNSGLIDAESDLEIEAEGNIENRGALRAGEKLGLKAIQDIENISGRIEAAGVEISSREGSIINRRNSEDYAYSAHELSLTTTLLEDAAVIEAENQLRLDAATQILVEGSAVSGGQVNLKASTVDINTTEKNESFFLGDKKNHVKDSATTHFASTVNGQDIVILSSGKTRVSGSALSAGQKLRISAGELQVEAVNDSNYFASLETNDRTFSKTKSSKQSFRSRNVGSELNAATVVLVTEHGDIELTGSDISANRRLVMNSAGNILVSAGHEGSLDESHKQRSGWFSGGSLYSEKEDLEGRVRQTAVTGKINAGVVELNAANDIELAGIEIAVAEKLSASAQDISVRNANNEETRYSKHTEISVGFDDLVSNLGDIDELIQTEDGKVTLKLADARYEHAENVTTETTVVASQIEAGEIQFNAEEEAGGDILIEGSDLLANDSIELNATGDVALLDAQNTSSSEDLTQTGTAELNLVLRNEYDQVTRSIKAVRQAERDLRDARDDYDNYKKELASQESDFEQLRQDFAAGKGFIEQADIEDFERHLDRFRDDKEFYETNIALAAVTLTSKSTALIEQTGRAASSSATYGFNLSLGLDIDALEQQVDAFYQQSRSSNLAAEQIAINAGDTALVRGANLQADETIEIAADDIKILAGANTSQNQESRQQVNYGYSWDMLGAISSQDEDQLGGSIGGYDSRSDSESTQNINSQLLARNIRLNANSDTTIRGADIHAGETLEVNTLNLHVASVQDISFSETRAQGLSHSGTGSGVNSAEGENETLRTLTTSLTGREVSIAVGQHSEIQGAVIAAVDEQGVDNGRLVFSTDTLDASSLNNTVDNDNRSIALSGGEFSSLDYLNDSEQVKTRSLATIGIGDLQIHDLESSNTRFLNSDISQTEVSIYDIESHQGLAGEIDTRLFTESGRDQIAEDWLKTGMIANTIKLIAANNTVDLEDFFDETEKHHDSYRALKQAIATNPVLAEALQNPYLSAEQKEQMANQLTAAVMLRLGYEEYLNNIIASDESGRDGVQVYGFYSTDTGEAYINDQSLGDFQGLVAAIGHEATRAMDHQDNVDFDQNRLDRARYAENYGENFANYTDHALDINGYDQGMAKTNHHVDNAGLLVQDNNRVFAGLNKAKGDNYCVNSYECYGADTEARLKQSITNPAPIAHLKNYQIREKIATDGSIVGYEAFNLESENIIVMKPEELNAFVQVVEAIPAVGYALESMTTVEHVSNNATNGLHDDGYLGGAERAWQLYLSDPDTYIEALIGIAGAGTVSKVSKLSKIDKKLDVDTTKTDRKIVYYESPQSYFDDLASKATRNPDSNKLVLGRGFEDGKSYTKVAAHYKASYFKLDNWTELSKTHTPDQIWRINETFLDHQLKAGKEIILSHNPAKATRFYLREVQYLEDLGYKFVQDGWVWKAVK